MTEVGSWRVQRCPMCRCEVIEAVGERGAPVRLDPEPSADGVYALSARFEALPHAYRPKPYLAFGRPLRRKHTDPCVPPAEPRAPVRPGSTPRLGQHRFDPYPTTGDVDDPEVHPADPYTGRATCRTCKALGKEGDQRHPAELAQALPTPDPARIKAAAALDARRLGERDDD